MKKPMPVNMKNEFMAINLSSPYPSSVSQNLQFYPHNPNSLEVPKCCPPRCHNLQFNNSVFDPLKGSLTFPFDQILGLPLPHPPLEDLLNFVLLVTHLSC